MTIKHVTKDYDVIFISYQEPNKEQNFNELLKFVPNAKRIDGVAGFDKAHKAAAKLATTERVLIIDGDNWVWDIIGDLFIDDEVVPKNSVVSWCAINQINGLTYGNGGPKLWPTEVLLNLNSHENATSDDGAIDFFWIVDYLQNNNAVSFTVPNGSAEQAFAAGYREGVKMSLIDGKQISDPAILKPASITYNFQRLCIWCSVGIDVQFGEWAMHGARLGWYNTCIGGCDIMSINDLDKLYAMANEFETLEHLKSHTNKLLSSVDCENTYGMLIRDLDADMSKFVKHIGYGRLRTGNARAIV